MNELDLYSAYSLPATTTKKKSRKSKKKNFKWFFIIILVMCFLMVFFVANAFSNLLAFSNISLFKAKPIIAKAYNVYAISVGEFEDEVSAQNFAEKLKLGGAGGFVMYDLSYCVILNAYLSSSDAQNVLEKILPTYENVELKTLEINRCQLSGIENQEQRGQVENALNIFKDTYQKLYEISVNLDLGKITSSEAKVKLTELLNQASIKASNFREVVSEMGETSFSLAQAKVDQVVSLLNNLVQSALVSTRLSSLIKYDQIVCLNLQNELALLLA